jgi:hypothetical protein
MVMEYLISALVLSVGVAFLILAFAFCTVGYKVARGDHHEYERNRLRTESLFDALKGRAKTHFDGKRDHRVGAGITENTKENRWVDNGMLSEEAIDSTI